MKKIVLTVMLAVYSSMLVLAQDEKKVDINVNTKGNAWYTSPVVWIIGAAVFILLLVALTRSGRRD